VTPVDLDRFGIDPSDTVDLDLEWPIANYDWTATHPAGCDCTPCDDRIDFAERTARLSAARLADGGRQTIDSYRREVAAADLQNHPETGE